MESTALVAINSLRSNIQDLVVTEEKLQDDLYLLAWLVVRKMHVQKTEQAIREAFTWYKQRQPDAVARTCPQGLIDLMPIFLDGVSVKDGLGVCYVRAEAFDPHKILKGFTREEVNRYGLWITLKGERIMLPLLRKKIVSEGPKAMESARPYVVIVDCYGFSMKNFPPFKALHIFAEMALEAVKFPTCAREGYLIGVNKLFMSIVRPVAPILSRLGVTIKVFGPDEKDWAPEVYQIITPQQLEAYRQRVRNLFEPVKPEKE